MMKRKIPNAAIEDKVAFAENRNSKNWSGDPSPMPNLLLESLVAILYGN
jgi:hypothetical protein